MKVGTPNPTPLFKEVKEYDDIETKEKNSGKHYQHGVSK